MTRPLQDDDRIGGVGLFGAAAAQLGPNQRVLLTLADPLMDGARGTSVRGLLADLAAELDWAWIWDQAARHNVTPLIGWNIARHRLHQPLAGALDLIPYHWLPRAVYTGNRERNRALSEEFRAILDGAAQRGIAHAVRKGPVMVERYSPDLGARRMNDLDLLVGRADVPAFGELLSSLGYTQGRLTPEGEVEPFARSTRAFWALNVNNALPFIKKSGLAHATHFEIDLCLDLVPAAGPGAPERTAAFLARSVSTAASGTRSRRLSDGDELLDLCVHLYKEADARHYIAQGKDLGLSKFIDVALCARALGEDGFRPLVALAREYNVQSAVFFALHHTATLFPAAVPQQLLDEIRPEDAGVLDEFGRLEGNPARWDTGFLDRLFRTDRTSRAGAESLLPGA
jgi:hypothetical protein